MRTIRDASLEVLKRFLAAVISTVGVFVLFGFVLERLEIIITGRMYQDIGGAAVLFTAVVGTPLHEIAHWLGCKLFGFHVVEVRLLRPIEYKNDGILGYVSYQISSDSWWSKLGSVITGMAPMILGSVFIILIVYFLTPEVFDSVRRSIYDRKKSEIPILSCWWAAFTGFWKGVAGLRKWGILRGVICLYLVMSVSMHMTVSPQDITSAARGFGLLAVLYLIFAIVTAAIGNEYKKTALLTGGFISMILSIGLLSDLILLLLTIVF